MPPAKASDVLIHIPAAHRASSCSKSWHDLTSSQMESHKISDDSMTTFARGTDDIRCCFFGPSCYHILPWIMCTNTKLCQPGSCEARVETLKYSILLRDKNMSMYRFKETIDSISLDVSIKRVPVVLRLYGDWIRGP